MKQYLIDAWMRRLTEIADTAGIAGREPVRYPYSFRDRTNAKKFFLKLKDEGRFQQHSGRWPSYRALLDLLGQRLGPDQWHELFAANVADNLGYLVGGPEVNEDYAYDWCRKCFGLLKIDDETFMVGMNRHYYDHGGSWTPSTLRRRQK